MSKSRIWVVMKRVLIQIRRDKRTFGMMMVMPMIIMVIFGFALSGEVTNVPIIIDNADVLYTGHYGPSTTKIFGIGDNITTNLNKDERVKVTLGNFAQSKEEVDKSNYFAVVLLSANLSECAYLRSLGQNITLQIEIYLDATKPSIKASILAAISDAVKEALGGGSGIEIQQELAFGGAEYSGLDVSIPSVMTMVLTFLVMIISLLIIIRERIGGTQTRLYGTPLKAYERLLGYCGALLTLGVLMAAVVLLIGVFVFGAVVKGNIWLLLLYAILFALTHVLFSIFLSNFAKNELQAIQFAPLISFPSMALSGMLVPVNSLPSYIQPICRFIPMYYGNRLFEGVMLKGYNFTEMLPDFLVVIVMALLFFGLALITVKDRMDD